MQQSLERRNRILSVNEVKKRLKKAVLEINDVLINAKYVRKFNLQIQTRSISRDLF